MRSFTLDVNGEARPMRHPTEAIAVLELVRTEAVDFAIVVDNHGSYVQCAGGNGTLVGEWRSVSPAGFTHYSLATASGAERLGIVEMADALSQFVTSGQVGAPLQLNDISARFQ